ncbi:MAG TPA: hypothetical protein VK029_01805 [Pseudogracilibacillus sp.]|nr:hypothetical protein [Pseudogracilibacillus sp.]
MIQQIETKNSTIHALYQSSVEDHKRTSNVPLSQKDKITISKESLAKFQASLTLRTGTDQDALIQNFRTFVEEYNSPEAVEQRKLEQLEKEQAYNPLTDEFNLLVKRSFPENTLHHTIHEAMEGKVKNASLYAAELAGSIRSSISMAHKSIEERAAYREMALKQAEYVAENFFDNEEERAAFMDEINRYYENDLLREKGYVVFDNSDLEPFKRYSSPRDNGKVSYMTFAREYMDEDTFERWITNEATKEEIDKFFRQLVSNQEKWSREIIEEAELHTQRVEKAIANVQEMLESFVWVDGRVIATGEEQPDYLDELIQWNENMLNLFL